MMFRNTFGNLEVDKRTKIIDRAIFGGSEISGREVSRDDHRRRIPDEHGQADGLNQS
jgi:hypothetical protein